jgi:predicted deacylase
MPLPDFEATGDLPIGVHRANLQEVLERFGAASGPRRVVTGSLVHVDELAQGTKHVQRLIRKLRQSSPSLIRWSEPSVDGSTP